MNGKEYGAVEARTILHHLAEPWARRLNEQGYYYCTDPGCDVVYFGEDGSVIGQSALRTRIGIKESAPERPVCYCFGVTYQAAASDGQARAFVEEMTRQALCSCETSNPSGRCCLKDFPRR